MNNGFVRLRLKFREIGSATGGGDPRGGGSSSDPRAGGGDPRGGGRGGGFRGSPELVPRWDGAAQFRPGDRRGGSESSADPRSFGGGEGDFPTGPLPQTTYIKELKVTFVREQGVMSGRLKINLNSTDNQPDDNGWRLYTLALKDMTSAPGTSGAIRRVVLTSDTQDTFNLAQMALVVETGQMTASLRTPAKPAGTQVADIEWKPGVPLTLVADVEAGAADPQVEWNFDADNVGNLPAPAVNGDTLNGDGTGNGERGGDPRMGGMMGDPRERGRDPRGQLGIGGGRDPRTRGGEEGDGGQPAFIGPRIDARGLTATYTYPNEEQNYRVEVTVRDRSGQKQPVKASILVRIRG